MEFFLGTKAVNGEPMTRLEYNILRGWALPEDEAGSDKGYLVEYLDGGKANHPNYDGYISWSPKAQFDNAYQASGSFSFGHAIELMKKGYKVCRSGWNGKGMYLEYIAGYEAEGGTVKLPYIELSTVTQAEVPWLASQTDVLTNDWMLVK